MKAANSHLDSPLRRCFLGGLLSTTLLPVSAQSLPCNPDVVVVGAGSAGLAAARTLIAAGKTVVVLEAANRIGGRAYTESSTFGLPFDHGCSWVMGGKSLPYADMAKAWGYDLLEHQSAGEALFVGNRRASDQEQQKYDNAWAITESAINRAGYKGLDVSAASVVPKDLVYNGVVQTWMGAMDWAVDFDNLSTLDVYKYGDIYSSYMVKQGYGTIVSRMGAELPVQLNTPVTRIHWQDDEIKIETSDGDIRSKACIVTVSTGVLRADSIAFNPALPEWKLRAIDNLPMGLLAKISMQFDTERFGLTPNQLLTY